MGKQGDSSELNREYVLGIQDIGAGPSTYPNPQINQSRSKQIQDLIQTLIQSTGVLRGEWKNNRGRLQTICYGTAFAVSKRVIMTCAHSIYLQKKKRPCTSFTFIRGIEEEGKTSSDMIYRCSSIDFLEFQPLREGQSYLKSPISIDIALLYLDRDLPISDFLKVGVESEDQLINKQLEIIGYPSESFYQCTNIFEARFKRVDVEGQVLQIKDSIIYHNLATKIGHSGSAIAGSVEGEEGVVVGVHTHKGTKRNSGVYLSRQVLTKLIKYQINFAQNHEEYKMSIKFPKALRDHALHSLDEATLEKILPAVDYSESLLPSDDQALANQACNEAVIEVSPQKQQPKSVVSLSEELQLNSAGINKWRQHYECKVAKIEGLIEANRASLKEERESDQLYNLLYNYFKVNEEILKAVQNVYCSMRESYSEEMTVNKKYYSRFIEFESNLSLELSRLQEAKLPEFKVYFEPSQVSQVKTVDEHLRQLKEEVRGQQQGEVGQMDESVFKELYSQYQGAWLEENVGLQRGIAQPFGV